MAEEIKMWKASDGSVHKSLEEAEERDCRLQCISYFDNNPLLGPYEGCKTSGSEFMDYVDEHHEILTKYLTIKWKEITQ